MWRVKAALGLAADRASQLAECMHPNYTGLSRKPDRFASFNMHTSSVDSSRLLPLSASSSRGGLRLAHRSVQRQHPRDPKAVSRQDQTSCVRPSTIEGIHATENNRDGARGSAPLRLPRAVCPTPLRSLRRACRARSIDQLLHHHVLRGILGASVSSVSDHLAPLSLLDALATAAASRAKQQRLCSRDGKTLALRSAAHARVSAPMSGGGNRSLPLCSRQHVSLRVGSCCPLVCVLAIRGCVLDIRKCNQSKERTSSASIGRSAFVRRPCAALAHGHQGVQVHYRDTSWIERRRRLCSQHGGPRAHSVYSLASTRRSERASRRWFRRLERHVRP